MQKKTGMVAVVMLGISIVAVGQEAGKQRSEASQSSHAPQPAKASAISASGRLTSAKTIFIKQGRGSEIPLNVISSGLEGWGRYTLVGTPEKADLVVEISAPADSSGVSISSSTGQNAYGKEESTTKTTRELGSSAMITMTVYDARNNVPLWRGSEQSKSAMKQKARQDNMVEASQRLLSKFRDRVEPIQ